MEIFLFNLQCKHESKQVGVCNMKQHYKIIHYPMLLIFSLFRDCAWRVMKKMNKTGSVFSPLYLTVQYCENFSLEINIQKKQNRIKLNVSNVTHKPKYHSWKIRIQELKSLSVGPTLWNVEKIIINYI